MRYMIRIGAGFLGIARLVAIAAILMLAPYSAAMAGTSSHITGASPTGIVGLDHTAVSPDNLGNDGSPENQPVHCHLRSPDAQEVGPTQTSLTDDLPLQVPHRISALPRKTDTDMPAALARVPIHAPPSFILFGNFRS